ncbi:unnamed protein product, partial [Rhizoctonia solani]
LVETCALQTTGEGEDVANHVQKMNDLLACYCNQEVQHQDDTAVAKAKANIKKTAGKEMHLVAMKNLVHCGKLTNVTNTKGSTLHEKGGQRTECKHANDKGDNTRQKKPHMS